MMKEDQEMKSMGKWKKKAAVTMAAVMMAGSLTVPVMAHGHGHGYGCGGGHHSVCSSVQRPAGVYCAYHDARHRTKSTCKRYCPKHKVTHANGKIHKVRRCAVRR